MDLGDIAGAVGGVVGSVVAGPVGAVVGAQIGQAATEGLSGPQRPDFHNDQAAAAGNHARDVNEAAKQQLWQDFSGEFDAVMLSVMENFYTFPHQSMWDFAQQMKPDRVNDCARVLTTAGQQYGQRSEDFTRQITAVIAEGMAGRTAEAMQGFIARFGATASRVGAGVALVGNKFAEVGTATVQVPAMMPPPVPAAALNLGEMIINTLTPFDVKDQNIAAQEARMEAARVMTNVYAPVYKQTSQQLPVLPTAQRPDGAGAGTRTTSGGGVSSGGRSVDPGSLYFGQPQPGSVSSAGHEQPPVTPASPVDNQPGLGQPVGGRSPAAAQMPSYDDEQDNSLIDWTGPANQVRSTGVDPALASGTGSGWAGSNTGAGLGSGSGSGSGFGAGAGYHSGSGAGGFTSGVTGGGQAGAGSSGAGSPGGGRGATGMAGTPGMAGMGPMGGAGAGKRRSEDEDERDYHPDYLITIGNGKDLFGPIRKVVPPVIGDWNDPNHP